MIGHTLGAAGAIEAIVTIQTIREGCVPPTINLDDPDPAGEGLDLDAERGAPPGRADRAVELVRVRRPEHGPDLPAVGRMTDDPTRGRRPGGARRGRSRARRGRQRRLVRAGRPRSTTGDAGERRRRAADLEPGDASLLALVDRLGSLLDRSELSELAVEAGGTRLVLRKPAAIAAGGDGRPPPRDRLARRGAPSGRRGRRPRTPAGPARRPPSRPRGRASRRR